MRAAPILVAVILFSAAVAADDRTVLFDEDADFSTFKTFTLRDGKIGSQRPELNSPITIKKLTDTIRSALVTKGLKETPGPSDLAVEFNVTASDFEIGPFGRVNPLGGRGRGRGPAPTSQPDFTDATLVIDLRAGEHGRLVWRGVYNDTENSPAKVAEALPKDALRLLADYPPKRKK